MELLESTEYRGHQALEARVTEAHEKFVRDGGFVFRAAGDVLAHHDAVRFTTYLVPADGGPVARTGFVFLQLGADGRIRCDYQFADPPSADVPAALRRRRVQHPRAQRLRW